MSDNVSTAVDPIEDGILWMINTAIFHPRGLALCRHTSSKDFYLVGDGEEVWIFGEDDSQEKKDQFDAMIKRHLEKVNAT